MYQNKYKYLFILFLVVYSHLNILFTQGDKLFVFELPQYALFLILLGIISILWESNGWLGKRWAAWTHKDLHRLIGTFISSVVLLMVTIVTPVVIILYLLEYSTAEIISNFKLSAGFSFRVNLFLNCVHAIYYYVNKLELARTETERLKKEQAQAQLSALQSQVNPHFLFNNLNVLSSLVRKDAEKAEEFIQQLSQVYRYILQNQDKSLTPLRAELDFISSYLYLLHIRFPKGFTAEIEELPPSLQEVQVPPMTLQILVENVIKHNQVNAEESLHLRIFYDPVSKYMKVENNRIYKEVLDESNGYGLVNIKNRYDLMSRQPVRVHESNNLFSVSVPLISL